jgi:hypothetical protein
MQQETNITFLQQAYHKVGLTCLVSALMHSIIENAKAAVRGTIDIICQVTSRSIIYTQHAKFFARKCGPGKAQAWVSLEGLVCATTKRRSVHDVGSIIIA